MKRLFLALALMICATTGAALAECRTNAECYPELYEEVRAYLHRITRPPATFEEREKDVKAQGERIRAWEARCKPVITPDANGIGRYTYAHADCAGVQVTTP